MILHRNLTQVFRVQSGSSYCFAMPSHPTSLSKMHTSHKMLGCRTAIVIAVCSFTKLPRPGDSKGTIVVFEISGTCRPILTLFLFIAERQAGKLWLPTFKVYWSDSTREPNSSLPFSYIKLQLKTSLSGYINWCASTHYFNSDEKQFTRLYISVFTSDCILSPTNGSLTSLEKPPGSSYASQWHIAIWPWITHMLFRLSIHLHHFQVIECDIYV